MFPVALTIAGSDPSGGAGIQADLKTFHAHRVYGQAVISLLTVQNSLGVTRVEPVDESLIAAQIAALFSDMPPAAIKTGALASPEAISVVADAARHHPALWVIDPVLRATSGHAFAQHEMREAIERELFPIATLITPNRDELAWLAARAIDDLASAEDAARTLLARGARAVLVKGGHFGSGEEVIDLLVRHDRATLSLRAARIATAHTHGTGCTYSASITAWLARGCDLETAVTRAKAWLSAVIAQPLGLGHGRGPLNHFVELPENES